MAGTDPTHAEPGPGALVGDIVEDARELLNQQLLLFKAEVRQDVVKAKSAAVLLAGGAAAGLLAAILLSLMLVHLVLWAAPTAPTWVGYAAVGVFLVIVGGGLAYWAMSRVTTTLNPLPVQSVQGVKENVEWKTAPR